MSREFTPYHRAPLGGEYYVFRDAVHNLIEIDDEDQGTYVRDLLRTQEMQRLRQIRQNGMTFFVYQSLETTRFPHALGSFHIAGRVARSLMDRQPSFEEGFPQSMRLSPSDCFAFSIAALLHDIGHGPLSHVWEEVWAKPRNLTNFHETMGSRIISDPETEVGKVLLNRRMRSETPGTEAISFIERKHPLRYLAPLLAGNLDIDRLDFTSRDTRSAGVTYGFHDLEWIIRSLRFARLPEASTGGAGPQWIIAIDGRKGLNTLVQFLHARDNMYRLVYHHKTTRSCTGMLRLLFERASGLAREGKLDCASPALQHALASVDLQPKAFLNLDDTDVWMTLKGWARHSTDTILRDLSHRMMRRAFFKVFLLSDHVYKRLQDLDSPEFGNTLAKKVAFRLNCPVDEARFYYLFDKSEYDLVGRRPNDLIDEVWVMESAALGFEFRKLREFWDKEIGGPQSRTQPMLIVHPEVVPDLQDIVERLSFPGPSANNMLDEVVSAPSPYRVLAPLGAEGRWKSVFVGALTNPGAHPETIVALKRYKGESDGQERDVVGPNLLLAGEHRNLSMATLLPPVGDETWIAERLWTASLEDLIRRQGTRRDAAEILAIGSDLFAGLAQLHSQRLRHTDIKPDNCGIMSESHEGQRNVRYVLGDFGCLSSQPDATPRSPQLLGTLRTRAPEVISDRRMSLAADVWAMGATMFAMCMMEYPFIPFDTPHEDTSARGTREAEIRANLSTYLAKFEKKVADDLPPYLSDLLRPCFAPIEDRKSARDVASLFQAACRDLRGKQASRHRWAWRRAEDLIRVSEKADLGGRMAEETKELLGESGRFVPPSIAANLANLKS